MLALRLLQLALIPLWLDLKPHSTGLRTLPGLIAETPYLALRPLLLALRPILLALRLLQLALRHLQLALRPLQLAPRPHLLAQTFLTGPDSFSWP